MTNPCTLWCQPLSRLVSLLSVMGGLAGLMPILAACSPGTVSNSPTPTPTSLSFSDEEIKNYAKVVLAIEPKRQAAYQEIQRTTKGGKIPPLACNQPDSVASLPRDIQNIAVNYCNEAKKIGESNGLTMSRFNEITLSAQSDPNLQTRIQNQLLSLRR